MNLQKINKLLKDPIGIGLYFLFEKWRTQDGRRVLSTNLYKKLAKRINRRKYFRFQPARDRFLKQFLEQHPTEYPNNFMQDGWTLFEQDYFPHTADVVRLGKEMFEARGADVSRKVMPYSIAHFDELLNIDAFYQFAFSEKMIAHAAKYIGEYPVLVSIELLRSDPKPEQAWIESQQLHLDVIDSKVFRVVVLVSDVDEQNGPFTFYPASVSDKIKRDKKIKYGSPLSSMNIEDARMGDYANEDIVEISGQAGKVLTVDTCNCFHYGSRAKSRSRCVLMLSYASPALENLRGSMKLDLIPDIRASDPEFVKLVKDKEYMPTEAPSILQD
ncbi:hypothetical protein KIH87_01900 [Paraneptunicella aestuarii]|uniref:hypothetical protein n=1 Tax=Paraneptunicella aestuarii TaxID=2831148 RepID=UPI001E57CB37|nr:hypothetical protein [Paraneptunicella aestuarii]UAA39143.1 hypothetical protein KIH87_01900 [Paraneptunicella aestuarii]